MNTQVHTHTHTHTHRYAHIYTLQRDKIIRTTRIGNDLDVAILRECKVTIINMLRALLPIVDNMNDQLGISVEIWKLIRTSQMEMLKIKTNK